MHRRQWQEEASFGGGQSIALVLRNLMARLGAEPWQQVLFYLDELDVIRLHLSGDRVVQKVLETRHSACLPAGYFQIDKRPSIFPGLQSLRRLELDADHQIRIAPLDDLNWPSTLVVLRIDIGLRSHPFKVNSVDAIPARSRELELQFPVLAEFYCKRPLGWCVFPSSLTTLELGTSSPSDEALSLLSRLVTLKLQGSYFAGDLTVLPTTMENLSVLWHTDRVANVMRQQLPHFAHSLKTLSFYSGGWKPTEEDLSCLYVLQRLESLQIKEVRLPKDLNFRNILPPRLTSLSLDQPVPPSQYEQLPRTIRKVTYLHRVIETVNIKWDLNNAKVCDLPPALEIVRLASAVPPNQSKTTLEGFQHFSRLTTFDMRWTSVKASEYRHLPPTITSLHLHAVTLPKARLLSELFPKLADVGLYGGTLTKSIAKCLPRNLRSLTLSHLALVTKGHYHPSGDPMKPESYSSASNPQLGALAELPPRLNSFTLFVSIAHKYWSTHLGTILCKLPFASTLLTLILDYGTRICTENTFVQWSTQTENGENEPEPESFSRFEHLQHLALSSRNLARTDDILLFLPRSLVALQLPESAWPAYIANDIKARSQVPHLPLLEFCSGGFHDGPNAPDWYSHYPHQHWHPIWARTYPRFYRKGSK